MAAQRPTEVHMDIKDLIRVGDAQMRTPTMETGALLLGKIQGTAFEVDGCLGLGLGDNPGTRTFKVGAPTISTIHTNSISKLGCV